MMKHRKPVGLPYIPRHKWTPAQDRRMVEAYPNTDTADLAVALGLSVTQLYYRADKLKIKKSAEYMTELTRRATHRGRLSLEAFRAIHTWSAANQPAWATRAMELAIVTAQRRGDVAAMRFAAIDDGHLRIEQQKSGGATKIAIPLPLHLDALGWTVGDIIARCRDAVLSRYLVHHSTPAGRAKSGDKIRDMTLGQAFAEARDAVGVSVAGKTPPTFHEIRSLSARLYAEQGNVDVQALLGHKSASMTSIYRDVRGDEWIKVQC